MEELDSRSLHRIMCLSTKSGVSCQTAQAFAIILSASLSVTYLDMASNCEWQSRMWLQANSLKFVWSLFDSHPSKPVEETR